MVLERDQIALDWLDKFKMANTKQLAKLTYSDNICITSNRMNRLCKDKVAYKKRNIYDKGYLYSTKPISSLKQYHHNMKRNEFYFKLADYGVEFTRITVEEEYGSVRPDIFIQFKYSGRYYTFFVEIETSNNTIKPKYNNFFIAEYKNYFKAEIPIIYVTDKPIRNKNFNYDYIKVALDLHDIERIFTEG